MQYQEIKALTHHIKKKITGRKDKATKHIRYLHYKTVTPFH